MLPTSELLILKCVVIVVMGAASARLYVCASREPRGSFEFLSGNALSVLLGLLAISELAHAIELVRGAWS